MGEPAETDLLQAIRESLQKDGILGRFKGEIRAAVINVLNKNSDPGDAPEIPQETKLINELVREYLAWNGYLYTEQVMAAESYQTGERLTRDVLTTKMGVLDDAKTAKIPLLYYIVAGFQAQNEN
ncbi:centrosomal protein 20 [Dendroctonus ponderosae]|uniref:FGFR1 oncogene partner (FOP) N-terminal dimerisation domain-containing protein n=1 Tax=Dendroctonus ponderosae TaxID=77166 RepID=J3JYZ3_DENPD